MRLLLKCALIAMMLIGAIVLPVSGHGRQVNFTINTPFALKNSGIILPPGKYILFRLSDNDRNLFALYEEDMMRTPLAIVRTVAVDFQPGRYPDKTRIQYEMAESSRNVQPELQGWTVPGMDGWEVIAVVSSRRARQLSQTVSRR